MVNTAKEYVDYQFFQQQIKLLIWLSLLPSIVFCIYEWMYGAYTVALVWYGVVFAVSSWGYGLYRYYETIASNDFALAEWYKSVKVFTYMVFALWTWVFIFYVPKLQSANPEIYLSYTAVFAQLGAAVVASALFVSDRKLFMSILLILILPLVFFFLSLHAWYGYVLALFALAYVALLLYATNNTYKLIQKAAYESRHDALTGLYNRRFFMQYMKKYLSGLKNDQKFAYLYMIDLDHFKTINDSLGHDIGDKLLQAVAERLKSFADTLHLVARIGGDEFAMISREFDDKDICYQESSGYAEELLERIRDPYLIDGYRLHISASIGVSCADLQASNASIGNYIKEADIAMYEVKARGRDGVIQFDKDFSKRISKELEIEKRLYFALRNDLIELHYQPLYDRESHLCGCEVLSRWKDSRYGDIGPKTFVAMAEKTGLIIELGNYVLEKSFRALADWEKRGHRCSRFSINISARQLKDGDFVESVKKTMKRYLPSNFQSTIYFEVTESILVEEMPRVTQTMESLKALGIRFAMDDFGTGYSSLGYLRELPVDELKVDSSFVRHIGSSIKDKKMIQTILSIAKTFGLKVVAEGVEKREQYKFLLDNGCDFFQGFYFDMPLSGDAFSRKFLLR